jgi:hypothetical protein
VRTSPRLTVKPNKVDIRLFDALGFEEGFDGLCVDTGDKFVSLRQDARTLPPIGERRAFHERPPQQVTLGVGVRPAH